MRVNRERDGRIGRNGRNGMRLIRRWFVSVIALLLLCGGAKSIAFAEEGTLRESGEEQYVLTEAYSGPVFSGGVCERADGNRSGSFSGIDEVTYRVLKQRIVKLASEKGNGLSTSFSLSMSDLGLENTSWSASDLGVGSMIQNNQISSDAVDAMMDRIICDFDRVIFALTTDLPYHLFWFDKTNGITVEPKGDLNVWYDSYVGDYRMSFSGTIVYSFYVSNEYSAGAFMISDSALTKAKNASAAAEKIVKKYASLSDYEKLSAYRYEINSLVDYDFSSLVSGVSYGAPWQLLNVFDGNDRTDCVCEGYAKAFQYLCDLTSFSSNKVNCRIVTGTIGEPGAQEPHMWNLVTMPDGKNYVVDVTNCENYDEYDGLLFLAGVTSDSWNGTGRLFRVRTLNKRNRAVTYPFQYDQATLSLYPAKDLELTTGLYTENNTVYRNGILPRPDRYLNVGASYDPVVPGGSPDRVELSQNAEAVISISAAGKYIGKKTGSFTLTMWKDGLGYRQKVIFEFADVKEKDHAYFYDAVYWAADQGITAGVMNQKSGYYETFAPQGDCTRAQMVSFLWRMAGSPEPKTKKMIFSDVYTKDYYYKAVLWGTENNIVGGYSDGTFRPKGSCTRQQAVTFLWRMAGKPEPPKGCKTFSDVKNPKEYYYDAVLWAADKGITGGYSDGTFRPKGNCTRAQMVTFLYRYNSKVLST